MKQQDNRGFTLDTNGKYKLDFTRGHTVDGKLDNEEEGDPSTDIREVRC